jgi:DNA-binding NarL/FixJ family response regulator
MLAAIAWALVKFFRYKINRQKELVAMELKQTSLEQELDYKSYELMLTIRYLIHKNEILTELQNEINDIKNHSSKYPIKNLKSMERIISEGLDTQTDDWKNAMSSLKLSQQGFFKKLMEQFPHLTTNDLRLCSYLRMNFSTKEIARLLNNSTRAVEISRYRLRKKMNLNHDVNLTEFLMSETFADTSSEPI